MGALRILAGGCVPAAVSLLLAVAAPGAARAAFELRDAAPMALGAVSPDGASLPFDSSSAGGSGLSWRAGGSRASLFEAEGLDLRIAARPPGEMQSCAEGTPSKPTTNQGKLQARGEAQMFQA